MVPAGRSITLVVYGHGSDIIDQVEVDLVSGQVRERVLSLAVVGDHHRSLALLIPLLNTNDAQELQSRYGTCHLKHTAA